LYKQGQHSAGLSWIRAAARQGEHPQALQFLASREGSRTTITLTEHERRAALAALATVDQAAQRQDAEALVRLIDDDAQILVRLPHERN
ncbi:hypothetical protein, partial [Escherichia coli]|uniref:hypothetical protein n=1 Tax=Escherichia coli TaxID=562 RepID=UPI0021C56B34